MVLLIVSDPERKARLSAILRGLGLESLWVRQCRDARKLLKSCPPVEMVVTDASLSDSNWCDVLRVMVDCYTQANVVVVAPASADEILWSEVMWRGVQDMLVEPYTDAEARRVLEGALRACGHRRNVAAAS
jgi:DNA-binding NtrC family response regulator